MGLPNVNRTLHLHRLHWLRTHLQVQLTSCFEDPSRYLRITPCHDDRSVFSAACEKSGHLSITGLLKTSRFRLFSVHGIQGPIGEETWLQLRAIGKLDSGDDGSSQALPPLPRWGTPRSIRVCECTGNNASTTVERIWYIGLLSSRLVCHERHLYEETQVFWRLHGHILWLFGHISR